MDQHGPSPIAPAVALNLADRLFAAIAANDLDALRNDVYSPDVVVWHNNDNHEQRLEENLKVLNWISRNITDRRYEAVRRQATDTGFVEQHVLRGTTADGTQLEVPACLVVTVENDRISRIDEYLDSAALAPVGG